MSELPERNFEFKVYDSYEQMSQAAANSIIQHFSNNPELLFCPATGNTPKRTYELVVKYSGERNQDMTKSRAIKFDEWAGILPNDPLSCEHSIRQQLITPLGISTFKSFGLESGNVPEEFKDIQDYLNEEGPIDLFILGMGLNGHLGFNEPAETLSPRIHKAKLTETTLRQHKLESIENRPEYGLTLGMSDILQAKQIILLVNGSHKKEAMARLLRKEIDTQFPASFLWLHPNVQCFCDKLAMGKLP